MDEDECKFSIVYPDGMELVLASQSPRRKELLENAGIACRICPAHIDESLRTGEKPPEFARRLAWEKAFAVNGELVLGADTVVVLDEEIFGKPTDAGDAARMLRKLSGREHAVITGFCLRGRQTLLDHETTRVWFNILSEREIAEYVATGEPMDKAGAYGIQGLASRYISRISGSYSNVVGLPVSRIYAWLTEQNHMQGTESSPLHELGSP